MFYNVYDNKLLIPGKSGSRFASSHKWVTEDRYDFPFHQIPFKFPSHLSSIEWIVLREPESLLQSAISTEVNARLTDYKEHGYEKLNMDTICDMIGNVLNVMTTLECAHYNLNLYKWIYEFYQSDVSNPNLQFIHLNELSSLINLMGPEGGDKFDRHNYDHSKSPYYISMKLIMEIIKNDFQKEWARLSLTMRRQHTYWDKLPITLMTSINRDTKNFL